MGTPTSASEGARMVDCICSLCGKDISEHKFQFSGKGCSIGDSGKLGGNMMVRSMHPWAVQMGGGIEAHHLICEALVNDIDDDNVWASICEIYNYDINNKKNGVYLPDKLPLACHLGVPLHSSNHGSGFGGDEYDADTRKTITYGKRIKGELEIIKKTYLIKDGTCPQKNEGKLIEDMDKLSKRVFDNIENFNWTLTFDAVNYKPGNPIGCGDAYRISEKQEQIDREQERLGRKTEVNGFRLYKRNIKYIREVRDAMLRNHLTPCNFRRNHGTTFRAIAPNQNLKYGGDY